MNHNNRTHKLRSIVLAVIMIVSVAGSGFAVVGSVAADGGSLGDETTNSVDDTVDEAEEAAERPGDAAEETTEGVDDETDRSRANSETDETVSESEKGVVTETFGSTEKITDGEAEAILNTMEAPSELTELDTFELVETVSSAPGISFERARELAVAQQVIADSEGDEIGLVASDGAGGNKSRLDGGADDQLPEGVESGNDTLQTQATSGTLPEEMVVELETKSGVVSFNTTQDAENINVVVLSGENGTEIDSRSSVESIENGSTVVLIEITDSENASDADTIRLSGLSFDAEAVGNDTVENMTWSVSTVGGEQLGYAEYDFEVVSQDDEGESSSEFAPAISVSDEYGGTAGAIAAGANDQRFYGPEESYDCPGSIVSSDCIQNPRGDDPVDRAQAVEIGAENLSSFPSQFTVSFSLNQSTGVTLSDNIGNVPLRLSEGTNAEVEIEKLNSTALIYSLSGFEASGSGVFATVDGLRFDATGGATDTDLSVGIGNAAGSYTLEIERLTFRPTGEATIKRGIDSQGTVSVEFSNQNKRSEELYEAGSEMQLVIPEEKRGEISFDRSSELSTSEEITSPQIRSNAIVFNVSEAIGSDDPSSYVERQQQEQNLPLEGDSTSRYAIGNIRFNVSGVDETDGEEAEIKSDLIFSYKTDTNTVGTTELLPFAPPIETVTPEYAFEPEGFSPVLIEGENGQEASSELRINISDPRGGQISDDETVEITAESNGVSFDATQKIVVANKSVINADEISVTDSRITVDIDISGRNTSNTGDYLLLERETQPRFNFFAERTGIAFDVRNGADNTVDFGIKTSAGDESVVQLAEEELTVTTGQAAFNSGDEFSAGVEANVKLLIINRDGDGVGDVEVLASGAGVSETTNTSSEGLAEFNITTNRTGEIAFETQQEVDGNTVRVTGDSVATLEPSLETIPTNTTTRIALRASGADGRGLPGRNITVDDSELNGSVSSDNIAYTGNGSYVTKIDTQDTDKGSQIEFGLAGVTDVSATVTVADVQADVSPAAIESGSPSSVNIDVIDFDGTPIEDADVTATGDPLVGSVAAVETGRGSYRLDLEPQAPGEVNITVRTEDTLVEKSISVEGALQLTPETITADDTQDTVEVSVTGVDDQPVEGTEVVAEVAEGDPFEGGPGVVGEAVTGENGTAAFALDPEFGGAVNVSAIGITETVEISGAVIDAQPTEIDVAASEEVTLTLEDESGNPLDADSVTASGPPLEEDAEATETGDGEYRFEGLEATQPGNITVSADGVQLEGDTTDLETTVEAVADVEIEPATITAGEASEIEVTATGADGEPYAGEPIETRGESAETDDQGVATLELSPDQVDSIAVEAVDLSATETVEAVATVDVDTDSLNEGETADIGVTVTGADDGGITGVKVTATGDALDSDTTATTDSSGAATLSLTPASGGTISIETGLGTAAETIEVTGGSGGLGGGGGFGGGGGSSSSTQDDDSEEPADPEPQLDELPDETVEAGTQAFEDDAPENPGVRVEFEEDIPVEGLTFAEDADGAVTAAELSELPDDIDEPEGEILSVMEIEVPDDVDDEPALVIFSVDQSDVDDPESVRLKHNPDGEWVSYEPTLVEESGGELVYEAQTEGFSPFAVTEQQDDEPTETPDQTATPENTDTPTDTPDNTEEAGAFGSVLVIIAGVVGVAALLFAVAGARIYQQDYPLDDDGFL